MKRAAVVLSIVGVLCLVAASPASASRYAFGEKETFFFYVSQQAADHSPVLTIEKAAGSTRDNTVPFPVDIVPQGGMILLSGLR